MRKLISILVVFTLFGCEKYELESPPKLTGGKWIFTDYEVTVISAISNVKVIKTDTVCITFFNIQQLTDSNLILKQDYSKTAIDRRFIKGKTTWEFDSNNKQLYCDYQQMVGNVKPEPFWVNLSLYDNNLEVMNTTNGAVTNYTYRANDVGYPRTLTLLSPPIVTDLYMSNGARDKAVTVRVTLYFSR
jgi:hypothetical protein